MTPMPLAYVHFLEKPEWERPGGPVDPGWGVDEGRPGQGLPGFPGRPGHLPSRPGRPIDPGFGWGGGERPGHLPSYGGRPIDPGYGVEEGGEIGIWPVPPEGGALPGVPGQPLPPVDPPPGTIWPPLPPSIPAGKAVALVAISGVGYRYVVITIPPAGERPGVPPAGGIGGRPPQRPTPPGAPEVDPTRR
jgi:hypothetical protein